MNGAQDLGGMHGFGPVVPEPEDEPLFHAPWERRAFGLTLAMGATGSWTLDTSRHARESLPPAEYLAASYYEIWAKGLERLLLAKGLATADELATGHSVTPPARLTRVLTADAVPAALARGGPTSRDAAAPPRFSIGERVRTIVAHPAGHTRLPRYARGRRGIVERDHGVFVFADANAMGLGPRPQHLYSVRFSARELWGPEALEHDGCYVDLWDDHLDPA